MKSMVAWFLIIGSSNCQEERHIIQASMGLKMIPISEEVEETFWISETEVTRLQWATISGDSLPEIGDRDKPKSDISLLDALRFSTFLTNRDRSSGIIGNELAYCVPTAKQWRLAAGEEQERNLPFEVSEAPRFSVFGMSPSNSPSSVKSKNPNKFGLYDMHGNLFEWTISFSSSIKRVGDGNLIDLDCMVVGGAYFSDLTECGFRSGASTQIDKRIGGVGLRLTLIKTNNLIFKDRANIVGVRSSE